MTLVVVGPYRPALEPLLRALAELNQAITVLPAGQALPRLVEAVALVPLEPGQPLAETAVAARERDWPWLGWNSADSPALALAAYQAGARAVLPATVTQEALRKALETLPDGRVPASGRRGGRREYRYRQGNVILPEPDTVVEVQDGILAVSVLHSDGAQVLLGLCGPGQMLVSHPHDSCSVQLVAHTDTAVALHTWAEAADRPEFAEQLRRRLQHLEAWAAMQARPHLDQRLLGLLSLLAEQFGRPHPQGTLINVRLTHTQLASAVGATRTTITRTLGALRKRGLLETIVVDDAEFFCLPKPEHIDHGLRTRAGEDRTAGRS